MRWRSLKHEDSISEQKANRAWRCGNWLKRWMKEKSTDANKPRLGLSIESITKNVGESRLSLFDPRAVVH